MIEVYADGSATTNKNPGGYAYVIVIDGKKYAECAGHLENATNNDAELAAAIHGLEAVLKLTLENHSSFPIESDVTLVSDSQLILGWASGKYKFTQIAKMNAYNDLIRLMRKLSAKTRWVKGHSGDEYNERCDKLANEARLGLVNRRDNAEKKVRGETLIGTKKSGIVCIWYKDTLKIIDLESNIIENYDRAIHGSRGSILQIREEKSR